MATIPNKVLTNRLTRFLTGRPILAKVLFFPWNRLSFFYRRLTIMEQGLIGVSSLQMHDLDNRKGRIGIGGVDETFWYSEIFPVLKRRLAEKIGEEEKDRFIYETAKEMGWKESNIALGNGRWVPKAFKPVFEDPELLATLRSDTELQEIFQRSVLTAVRLILNEGGWGNVLSLDLANDPITVRMNNLQEARYGKPAERPCCHYLAGYLAGFASRLFHCQADVKEVRCAACAGEECVFELIISADV